MKILPRIRPWAIALLTLVSVMVQAQEVNVTVTPVRSILPPQVMYYLSNPGQYFNISVQNVTSETQAIYFGLELRQVAPSSGMEIIVPGKTMPRQPVEVPAMQARVLNAAEMRNMFNHVRSEDIVMPSGLFENALSGSFGNLPEGNYELTLAAYRWDPHLTSPVLVSNPSMSKCTFSVCYEAQPPQWIAPVTLGDYEDKAICTLSKQTPLLQWMPPVENCGGAAHVYTYNLRVVQQLPQQAIDNAMDGNAVVYQATGLTVPQCMIPVHIINTLSTDETYIAQVTAQSNATQEGALDYVHLVNEGRSALNIFRIKDYSELPPIPQDSVPSDSTGTDSVTLIGLGRENLADSLYNFTNPEILMPTFSADEGARKLFVGSDIPVHWRKPWYEGGRGTQPDSVRFEYRVELFCAPDYMEREEMLGRKPVYEAEGVAGEQDTIPWESLKDKVQKGDYMLLRVTPRALNETSVCYLNDSINVADFAMTDRYHQRYFKCSNQVEIENERPTDLKAKDLKGKSVTVGEYELVLDGTLKDLDEQGYISGTGHVIWEPLGLTWKLAVRFDSIAINTANQVYRGTVVTYGGTKNKMSSAQVVDKLYSDWGLDNLIADTELPYSDKLQQAADRQVKGLAEQVNLAKYYEEVTSGLARAEGLLHGNLEDVGFPLEIPEEINSTPVNLQITTMKFAPTYAMMDLIGTFVVPETSATENQILVFGAPRICISPKSLIPDGSTLALLKDFEVKDPSTDYQITFKAPKDIQAPEDGCFVSWSEKKFEVLCLDMDMTLPGLKKVDGNGKATSEDAQAHLQARIHDWNDLVATGGVDAFEVEDLPGYTFTAQDVVVDCSGTENASGMAEFPEGYKLEEAGISTKDVHEWRGLYFKEISMAFPASIKVGNGKERMKVALQNMFVDKSGCTVDCAVVNAINYSAGDNGTIGGFTFTMDKIFAKIVQNNFSNFGFNGKLEIPLFKGTTHYDCHIYNQKFTQKGGGQGYAYVFKTYQFEDLSFDFMLGKLSLDKDLTYMLVEAIDDEAGETRTNAELLMGGKVTIAGAETVNKQLAKLPIDLTLPEIQFCRLRLANNKSFESVYERAMQEKAEKATDQMVEDAKKWWNEAKDIELGGDNKFYLNFGQWGYASPEKAIGPFTFALTKYDFQVQNEPGSKDKVLSITLGGDITFSKELEIKAGTAIEIQSWIRNIDDISNASLDYKTTKFREATLGFKTVGFEFNGTLELAEDDSDKGYSGSIEVSIGEGLFECEVLGGYFDHDGSDGRYSWGFFKVETGGCGIPIPPLKIDKIKGGLYFNCAYNKDDERHPKPSKGVIGIIMGMGISTIDEVTFKGSMDLTAVFDKDRKRLTTFLFNGDVNCLEGIISTKVSMVYQSDDQNQYFQLNVTADVGADTKSVEKVVGQVKSLTNELQALNETFEGVQSNVKGSLQGALKDNTDSKGDYNKNMRKYQQKQNEDKEASAKAMSASISLDIRIQTRKDGRNLKSSLWHVYLGQPDENLRCAFTLVDFKNDIVNVSVGANAYLCLGSELPNGGVLPPLPAKVSQFLDGKPHGNATSDSKTDVDNGRNSVTAGFTMNMAGNGGVMLGASVWGYINFNLGLFYGDMGATAGFDVSITKLPDNAMCVNLNGKRPGHDGWYGRGQLYAYLYAKFGFYVNLGFFKKRFTVFDAGIGGVFKAALPNPNYFTGKAKMKLYLLGGLVDLQKTFKFQCGDVCKLFMGNALDNYILFEDCSIGSEKIEDMLSSKIDWELASKPTIQTQASLNTTIDVVDPTALEDLRNGSKATGSNESALELLANRKFMFSLHPDFLPTLTEYKTYADAKNDRNGTTCELNSHRSGTRLTLDLFRLNPNRYYCLKVTGRAMEFRKKGWTHPETYDTIKGKYIETPWEQTKCYYFATGEDKTDYDDNADLEPEVKVAFPGDIRDGKMKLFSNSYLPAAYVDVCQPAISLRRKMKGQAYNKGTLVWRTFNMNGRELESQSNTWIENDSVSILTPSSPFTTVERGKYVRLKLQYQWTETIPSQGRWVMVKTTSVYGRNADEVRRNAEKNLNKRSFHVEVRRAEQMVMRDGTRDDQRKFTVVLYQFRKGNVTVTRVKDLMSLVCMPKDIDGDDAASYYGTQFLATRLDHVDVQEFIDSDPAYFNSSNEGEVLATFTDRNGKKALRLSDTPSTYLAYLGNLYFIGGKPIKSSKNYFNIDITTSTALKFTSPYGSWQGLLSNTNAQVFNGKRQLIPIMYMGSRVWREQLNTPYPLYSAYSSRLLGGTEAGVVNWHPLTEGTHLDVVRDLYYTCEQASRDIFLLQFVLKDNSKKEFRNWLNARFGDMITYQSPLGKRFFSISVPAYQFPLMWVGSERGLAAGMNLQNMVKMSPRHPRVTYSSWSRVLYWSILSERARPDAYASIPKVTFQADRALKDIKSMKFTRYRVNAWNFKQLRWTVYRGGALKAPTEKFYDTYWRNNPFGGGTGGHSNIRATPRPGTSKQPSSPTKELPGRGTIGNSKSNTRL